MIKKFAQSGEISPNLAALPTSQHFYLFGSFQTIGYTKLYNKLMRTFIPLPNIRRQDSN